MRFFDLFRKKSPGPPTVPSPSKSEMAKEATNIFMKIVPRVKGKILGIRPEGGWPFDLVVPPIECTLTFECPAAKNGHQGAPPTSNRIFFPSEASIIEAGELFASECTIPIRIRIWLPQKRTIDPQTRDSKLERPILTFETTTYAKAAAEAKLTT